MIREYLKSILLVTIAFLAPIEGVLATVGLLVVLDLITGLLASRKQGIPITSFGLKRTVVKLLVYEAAVLLAFLVNQYLTGPAIPLVHLVSSLIGVTELKSNYENINILSGGNLLTSIINAVQRLSSNDPGKGDSGMAP